MLSITTLGAALTLNCLVFTFCDATDPVAEEIFGPTLGSNPGKNRTHQNCIDLIYNARLLEVQTIKTVDSIAIDNGVIGDPEIECLQDEITFKIRSQKLFGGRIFAKGKAEDPQCVAASFAEQRTTEPMMELPLGLCGMKSLRSTDPRGMYYGITLVVSFHPVFLTKVDQAYHVKCFFEEAERGITAEIGVSMIPTTEANAVHGVKGCKYSIHRGTMDQVTSGLGAGTEIQYAKIGDKVVHQWECVDPMYGMLIRNCYVTDGMGQRAEVIDAQGCPVDPILITDIRYSSNLMQAFAESHVFKFADRPALWFFCQVQMCMKAVGHCDKVTPPTCSGAPVTPRPEFTTPGFVNTPIVEPGYGTPAPINPIEVTGPVIEVQYTPGPLNPNVSPNTGPNYGAPQINQHNPTATFPHGHTYGQFDQFADDNLVFAPEDSRFNDAKTPEPPSQIDVGPPTLKSVSSSVEFGVVDPKIETVLLKNPTRYLKVPGPSHRANSASPRTGILTESEALAGIFGPPPKATPLTVIFEARDSEDLFLPVEEDQRIEAFEDDVLNTTYVEESVTTLWNNKSKRHRPPVSNKKDYRVKSTFHVSGPKDLAATSKGRKTKLPDSTAVKGSGQVAKTPLHDDISAFHDMPGPQLVLDPDESEGQVAGQLIVYDLDEEAPNLRQSSKLHLSEPGTGKEDENAIFEDIPKPQLNVPGVQDSCAVNQTVFYATIGGFCGLTLVLVMLLVCMHRRLRLVTQLKSYREMDEAERYVPRSRSLKRDTTVMYLPDVSMNTRRN